MKKSSEFSKKEKDDQDTNCEKSALKMELPQLEFNSLYTEDLSITRKPSNLDRDAKLSYQSYILNKKKVNEKINSLSNSLCQGANLPRNTIDAFLINTDDRRNNESKKKILQFRENEFKSNSYYSHKNSNESGSEITDIKLDEVEKNSTDDLDSVVSKSKSNIKNDVKKEKKTKKLVSFNEADDLFIDSFKMTNSSTLKDEKKQVKKLFSANQSTNQDNSSNIHNESAIFVNNSFYNLLENETLSFLLKPAPIGLTIKCQIHRQKAFFSEYNFFLESEDKSLKILMVAKKSRRGTNPTVLLNLIDSNKNAEIQIAKLKSNMLGTQFTLYDNEQVLTMIQKAHEDRSSKREKIKTEYVTILYDVNLLGFKGPRKMTLLVPPIDEAMNRKDNKPSNESETLYSKWNRFKTQKNKSNRSSEIQNEIDDVVELINKKPTWNNDLRSYALNFDGRVSQPSVKNFQIIHQDNEEYIILQFGKIEKDIYTCDYAYPFCALQAFAVALSSLESKLACD